MRKKSEWSALTEVKKKILWWTIFPSNGWFTLLWSILNGKKSWVTFRLSRFSKSLSFSMPTMGSSFLVHRKKKKGLYSLQLNSSTVRWWQWLCSPKSARAVWHMIGSFIQYDPISIHDTSFRLVINGLDKSPFQRFSDRIRVQSAKVISSFSPDPLLGFLFEFMTQGSIE